MIHLALNDRQIVVAAFWSSADCAAYCRAWDCCHVPFNSASHEVPAIGSKYEA